MKTLNNILYSVHGRLSEFKADALIETDLIDMINLAQGDLIFELPDNALVRSTKKQGIASASGYEEYSLPTDHHKLLALMQNDEGGPDPLVAALAGAGAGNVNSGIHSYKMTCVVAAVESLASVSSNEVTTTGGDGKVNLTIPLGPTGTTARNIYRTEAGGSAYKLQQVVANNTATSAVQDNTADGSLTTALPAQTKTSTPRVSTLIGSDELYRIKNMPSEYQTNALERPYHWIENAKFTVYPIPIVTRVGYFQWSYIAKPTTMVSLADLCSFDDQYTDCLVWKTVMKALTSKKLDASAAASQYAASLQLAGVNLANVHRIG